MITTLLVQIWYDGARPASAPVVSGSYNSTAPPIGAFAFIRGYGGAAVASTGLDPGAKRTRGRAKRKRIEDEQRIEREYLESLNPPKPAPVIAPQKVAAEPAHIEPAVAAPAPEVVPSMPEMAQQMKAMQAKLDKLEQTLATVEFQNKYWAHFTSLLINTLH